MGVLRNSARRIGIAGELLAFLWSNKRWWLVPMIIVVLLFSVVIALAQSSAIAPFIYSFF